MTPRRPRSIAGTVARVHVASSLLTAAAVVAVGALVATAVVVHRDDASAVALARTVGTELQDHEAEPRADLAELVQHEIDEQQWFERRLEVWLDGEPLGEAPHDASLAPWHIDVGGCRFGRVLGSTQRICTVQTDARTTIVAAIAIAPILAMVWPSVGLTVAAALLTALLMTLVGQRRVRAVLLPLEQFERAIATVSPLDDHADLPLAWGADEVDLLAATFHELLVRVRQAVEREHRFTADAAHELRTPLTRLRGQLELALADAAATAQPTQDLSAAVRTCEALAHTVDALLALARDVVLAQDAVDLSDVVAHVVQAASPESRARMEVQVAQDLLVRGDESLLRLAVGNLVDNALKFSDGPVVVSMAEAKGGLVVAVDDEGPGIPDDEFQRVRSAFVRGAPGPVRVQGVGLGLALADHVARIHEGALTLTNRAPAGLHAALTLPRWTPAPTST